MKVISLPNPRAILIGLGILHYDVRGWAPRYLGEICLHATWRPGPRDPEMRLCLEEPFRSRLRQAGYRNLSELPYGAIIAVGRLERIHNAWKIRKTVPREELKFPWDRGCAWKFTGMRLLEKPVSIAGQTGLWVWKPPTGWAPEFRE